MYGTPRLRSAFPQTPQAAHQGARSFYNESPSHQPPRKELRTHPATAGRNTSANAPLIPVDVLDAPSQRLYMLTFYVALNAYRIYESYTASDDLDSTWLFLKWVSLDGVVLFGLQALRIPWLEWAFPTTLAAFLLHVVWNVFLMFRIPVGFILSFWIAVWKLAC